MRQRLHQRQRLFTGPCAPAPHTKHSHQRRAQPASPSIALATTWRLGLRTARRACQRFGLPLCVGGVFAFTLLLAIGCTVPPTTGGAGGTGGSGSTGGSGAPHARPTITITPPPDQSPIQLPTSPSSTTLPVGVAGVKPHLNGVPAFSTDDMASFVKHHPLPQNFGGGDPPTIVANEFLSGGALGQLLGTSAGRPDSAQMGFVLLKGHFVFLGAGPTSAPPAFPYAYELFDAQTGNLLMFGGLNQPPTPRSTPTTAPHGPAPTPTPRPVVNFKLNPTSRPQSCDQLASPLPALSVTLDNTGSTVAVGWSASAVEVTPNTTERWAGVSPSAGTIDAGKTATLTITPAKDLCSHLGTTTFNAHVSVKLTAGGSGTLSFTDAVQPYVIF